jgi:hypothetical protein
MGTYPYVVRQGEHLRSIASRLGLDPDVVWSHPENARLRAARPSMNMLCEADVLFVPEAKKKWLPVDVGRTNTFIAKVQRVKVAATIHGAGAPLADAEYRVIELPELGAQKTDADGRAAFEVPETFERATVDFPDTDLRVVLKVGHLDPLKTPSGMRQRLNNLGYSVRSSDSKSLRSALAMFQLGQDGLEPDGEPNEATVAALARAHRC